MSATIGIATPCYQHGQYLGAMLDSLLAQRFTDWACVVVIDGEDRVASDVAHSRAAADARIRVLEQPQRCGQAASRNAAIRALETPWLLPFDADDLMNREHLARLYDAALQRQRDDPARHPVVFTHARLLYPNGATTIYQYPAYIPDLLPDQVQMPGCSLYPRALYDALGGFDEAWDQGATDWMFYVRAAAADLISPVQLSGATWTYRQHDGFRAHRAGRVDVAVLRREMRRAYCGERRFGDPLPAP